LACLRPNLSCPGHLPLGAAPHPDNRRTRAAERRLANAHL